MLKMSHFAVQIAKDITGMCQELIVIASKKDLSIYKEELLRSGNDCEQIGVGSTQTP